VQLVFDNVFPLKNPDGSAVFVGDFLLHYTGTIPVKVTLANIECDNPNIPFTVEYWQSNEFGEPLVQYDGAMPIMGAQWENCEYLLVLVIVDLPQEDQYMDLDGTISGEISVIQWNEY
jgi:hypothetical protein